MPSTLSIVLSYITFGGTLAGTILEIVAFSLFFYLLIKLVLRRSKMSHVVEVSPSMINYIILELICTFFIGIYVAYIAIFWQRDSNNYNAYVLYILGAFQLSANNCKPPAVLALGLERIFCIWFPFSYSGQRKYYPIALTIIMQIIIVFLSLFVRIISNWPHSAYTTCASYGCLTTIASSEFHTVQRYILSGINLIAGAVLIFSIRHRFKNVSSLKVSFF